MAIRGPIVDALATIEGRPLVNAETAETAEHAQAGTTLGSRPHKLQFQLQILFVLLLPHKNACSRSANLVARVPSPRWVCSAVSAVSALTKAGLRS
jgi:hypothetical protein